MIKRAIVIAATAVVLLFGTCAIGGVSIVVNGSFEDDEQSIEDITTTAPNRWAIVFPGSTQFGGSVWADWSTQGDYYLNLYSNLGETFTAGDKAMISQQVYLQDVNEIIFDLKLDTYPATSWDPAKRSAFLQIDSDIVWVSNDQGSDVRGVYLDQVYEVNDIYKDESLHTLSVGIKANASETSFIQYWAMWDFIKFDTHCGGFGYLPEDLFPDCYIDMLDLKVLAEHWMEEDPLPKYDLYPDANDIVNFPDYDVLADAWMDYRDWADADDPDFIKFELLDSDLNNDGIVNFLDHAMLAEDWQEVGVGLIGDVDSSGAVDYDDVSQMAGEWLQKSWLYDL